MKVVSLPFDGNLCQSNFEKNGNHDVWKSGRITYRDNG